MDNIPTKNDNEEITLSSLSPEDYHKAQNYLKKINLDDSNLIFSFGVSAQNEIKKTSEMLLKTSSDTTSQNIDSVLENLVSEIKDFDNAVNSKKGFLGIFSSPEKERKKAEKKYYETINSISLIEEELNREKISLVRNITLMDSIYEANLKSYNELTIYTAVGNEVIARLNKKKAEKEVNAGADEMSRQELNELHDFIEKFSQRLHDIKLSRLISIQTAPQIRLLQASEKTLLSKVQSSINNTIPLWRNQTALLLGLSGAKDAIDTQKKLEDNISKKEFSKEEINKLNEEIVNSVSYDIEEIAKELEEKKEASSQIKSDIL